MSKIHIRRFSPGDLSELLKIDHSYSTEYVWRMDIQESISKVELKFRELKLPRAVQHSYPRDHRHLVDDWLEQWGILVGIYGQDIEAPPSGYITIKQGAADHIAHISDLAVAVPMRRRGLASALILSSEDWAINKNCTELILEMQSKNMPAIRLAQKLGYEFCGYSDRHFPNKDIAVFFGKGLH